MDLSSIGFVFILGGAAGLAAFVAVYLLTWRSLAAVEA
jgi:hypothetical protein